MDRLASCYFCGVAVEAPLEEYPVVPRDLRPSVEDQSTVVLCPECRRKLSTIVERVVGAIDDPDQTELTDVEGTRAYEGDDASVAGSSPAAAVERFDDDRPNLVDFGSDRNRGPGRSVSTLERESADADETDEEDESADGDRSDESSSAGERADSTSSATADEGTTATDEDDPANASAGDGPADEDAEATDADRSSGEESDDSTATRSDDADRDFATSSYNRVVRLLQNREFPVEEDEVTTVAGSAYGIGRRETEAVLDALVERGILDREGSQLYRNDD